MDLLEPGHYDSDEYLAGWLMSTWPSLAATCYQCFLLYGRGALFVDFANAEPYSGFADGLQAPIKYRPLEELEDECVEWELPKLIADVNRYDPEREAVFFVQRRTAGRVTALASAKSPTPKEAYERRLAELSAAPELASYRIAAG